MKNPPFNVTLFSAGSSTPATVYKLYLTHGPMCVYENMGDDGFPISLGRLDELEEMCIEDDLSTRKIITTGDSKTTAETGNMVKRAVVGGVLLGGAGALIGGTTGTKGTTINTQSIEEIDYLVNARLRFKSGKTLLIQINRPDIFSFISSFIGVNSMTLEDLNIERSLAIAEQEKMNQRHAQHERENQARRWALTQVPESRFSETEATNLSLILAVSIAGVYVYTTSDDSIWWWAFRVIFWGIIFAIPLIAGFSILAKKMKTKFDRKVEALTQQRLASLNDN